MKSHVFLATGTATADLFRKIRLIPEGISGLYFRWSDLSIIVYETRLEARGFGLGAKPHTPPLPPRASRLSPVSWYWSHGDDVAERRERVVAVVRAANLDLPPLRAGRHQADVIIRKIRGGISRRVAPVIIEVRAHPHLPERRRRGRK